MTHFCKVGYVVVMLANQPKGKREVFLMLLGPVLGQAKESIFSDSEIHDAKYFSFCGNAL